MRLTWQTLAFPREVASDGVAGLLRTLASEPHGGVLAARPPVVVETVLSSRAVSWRVGSAPARLGRLRRSAEASLPGMRWTDTVREPLRPDLAVELRVVGHERLLAVDHAEATARRLLGLSAELRGDERLVVQWCIGSWVTRSPIRPPGTRPEPTIWNVGRWGEPDRDSEQVSAARKKIAEPVFACVGRIAVLGASGARAQHLVAAAGGAMQLLRAPGVGVSRRAWPSFLVKERINGFGVSALSPPARLTAQELAGLVGWPLGNPAVPGVSYVSSRLLPLDERVTIPTSKATATDRVLGEAATASQSQRLVVLRPKEGTRHLHLAGPTGSGKTTVLIRLAVADITAGRGLVFVDPKGGDAIREILARIPREADERVVVIDPTDPAPVGFNPLQDGALGIDGIVSVIRATWPDTLGPRTTDVLLAGLGTLAATPGHSLTDLVALFHDPGFRRPLVARAVQVDPVGLGTFWPWFEGLSPQQSHQTMGPIMSRLRTLFLRPELRAVLGQAEPRFNLREVFTKRRALLVSLPKGQIGSDGARIIGASLVAATWRTAQARVAITPERRHPVALLLDEFHELIATPVDLGDALVQARSLGVGVVAAHQHLGQLDPALKAAILANTASRLVFRSDYDDAAVYAKRSGGTLSADDFMGLDPFHAYAQILAGDTTTAYGSLKTLPLDPPTRSVDEILMANRQRWGVPRSQTEARLNALLANTPGPPVDHDGPTGPVLGSRRLPEEPS